MGIETQLRRSLAVFRFAALAYPLVFLGIKLDELARPVGAATLMAIMIGWTGWISFSYARSGWTTAWLYCDLAMTLLLFAGSRWAFAYVDDSAVSPGPWLGGAVLAWAVAGGRRRGGIAAACVAAEGVVARGGWTENSITETVLLLLTGVVVGHLSRLAINAEIRSRRAAERAAAARERDRLARDIHDSVLQVLALVQRRGTALGGEAAELGRLAGEQETALRALIGSASYREPLTGQRDVRDLLGDFAGDRVSVSSPAMPVRLSTRAATALAAAVTSALDNVAVHCPDGTRAWILLEEDGDEVIVTVRDDGPGMAPGRLAEAAAQGRLGVATSIIGRVDDLGGAVLIESTPGDGTEVELRVPRSDDNIGRPVR